MKKGTKIFLALSAAIGIAEKPGLPVESISESIVGLGAGGVRQIGKGVKGAGEELKKVLK